MTFFLTILSIATCEELIRQLDLLWFQRFRWFGGLTCVFWAEFEEKIPGLPERLTSCSPLPLANGLASAARRIVFLDRNFFRRYGGARRHVRFRSGVSRVMLKQLDSPVGARYVDCLEARVTF